MRLFTTLSQRVALNVLSPFFHLISQAQKCRADAEQSMLVRHPSSGEERHCWIFLPVSLCGNLPLKFNIS